MPKTVHGWQLGHGSQITHLGRFTLWLFNIAMENGPFIDDFPMKTSIHKGFSMAMLNNPRVKGVALRFDQRSIRVCALECS